MKIVVALGGNALTTPKEKGSYQELVRNIRHACRSLKFLVEKHQVVIVSGSGPQVGNLLLQNELAKSKVPEMPLHVLDAELEGELGYLLQQSLLNELKQPSVTLLTQVVVAHDDPALKHPTKFVGPFYSKQQALALSKKGFVIKEDAGRGYRRVVPSPKPLRIMERDAIVSLLKKGLVVIAVGGGGIPIVQERGKVRGLNAVIDKDAAAARLALDIKADLLLIVTGVPAVYTAYGKKNQQMVRRLSVKDAEVLFAQGEFPPGSMGPKIRAACDFLNGGGKQVVITAPDKIAAALQGRAGTRVVR